jgi:hypothetical protein
MPKFLVFESYRIEHEVDADTAEEAIEKVSEDNEYQYTVQVRYDHAPGGPDYEYISQSTQALNLETYELTE